MWGNLSLAGWAMTLEVSCHLTTQAFQRCWKCNSGGFMSAGRWHSTPNISHSDCCLDKKLFEYSHCSFPTLWINLDTQMYLAKVVCFSRASPHWQSCWFFVRSSVPDYPQRSDCESVTCPSSCLSLSCILTGKRWKITKRVAGGEGQTVLLLQGWGTHTNRV